VTHKGRNVTNLNELEWANGYLWANVWMSKIIVKIDISTGKVVNEYDFTFIANHARAQAISNFNGFNLDLRNYCLNGIAWLKDDGYQGNEGSFYITGKKWPTVYLVKFNDKKK
jgi:glutamine cyclotransferase